MATDVEEESVSEPTDFLATDRDDLYSYTECKKIGKDFLHELKQSIIEESYLNLPEIEEPRVKATKYLEQTEILQLLEVSFQVIRCILKWLVM